MKRSRFTEEQIIGVLREQEAGMKVAEVCRKHGISEPTFYAWKAKFGGMSVSDAKRLKQLEDENAKLKKLLAEAMLDVAVLKDITPESIGARCSQNRCDPCARSTRAERVAAGLRDREWVSGLRSAACPEPKKPWFCVPGNTTQGPSLPLPFASEPTQLLVVHINPLPFQQQLQAPPAKPATRGREFLQPRLLLPRHCCVDADSAPRCDQRRRGAGGAPGSLRGREAGRCRAIARRSGGAGGGSGPAASVHLPSSAQ